jgi:hypothetical protein
MPCIIFLKYIHVSTARLGPNQPRSNQGNRDTLTQLALPPRLAYVEDRELCTGLNQAYIILYMPAESLFTLPTSRSKAEIKSKLVY